MRLSLQRTNRETSVTEPTRMRGPDHPAPSVSGSGMDRKVSRKRAKIAFGATAGFGVLAFAGFVWAVKPAPAGVYVIKASRLDIAEVRRGMLDESVTMLGVVAPAETVLIDAVEGGRVEKVLAHSGDFVAKGQVLLELTNTQLQLDVLARETEVSAQMNSLRSQELQLERSRLNDAEQIARNQAEIERLERQVTRSQRLAKEGALAPATLEDQQAQLDLQRKLQEIAKDAVATGERMSRSQMEQMGVATQRLERNLEAARTSMSQLTVRAPAAGALASFTPELGQTLTRGARIGQIDSAQDLKLAVSVDEYYLRRFQSGLPGVARVGEIECKLKVGRISAQVENGAFKADLLFVGPCPAQLRRGQSVSAKIVLSDAQPALTLPNGPFIAATAGRYAFVVDADGRGAGKRDIVLGRRNATSVEVVQGLKPGERVIVSDYEGFADSKALQIQK